MSQIHHCPYCGSGDQGVDDFLCIPTDRRSEADDILGDLRVRCENCDALGPPGVNREDAVTEWNAWIDNLLVTIKKMERKAQRDRAKAHHEVSRESGYDIQADGTTGR